VSHGSDDPASLDPVGEVTPPVPQLESDAGLRCHICQEPSEEICQRCTRDACANHLCGKCARCSDCCECE
jgi:hypothetical protein